MSAAGGGPGARGPVDDGERRPRGGGLPEEMIRESGENIRAYPIHERASMIEEDLLRDMPALPQKPERRFGI